MNSETKTNEKQNGMPDKYYVAGLVQKGCNFMEAVACSHSCIEAFKIARDDLAYYGKSSRRLFVIEVEAWQYNLTLERFQNGQKHFVCLSEDAMTVDELFERYPVDSEVLREAYKTMMTTEEDEA